MTEWPFHVGAEYKRIGESITYDSKLFPVCITKLEDMPHGKTKIFGTDTLSFHRKPDGTLEIELIYKGKDSKWHREKVD